MTPILYCLKLFLAILKEKGALLHATFSCVRCLDRGYGSDLVLVRGYIECGDQLAINMC